MIPTLVVRYLCLTADAAFAALLCTLLVVPGVRVIATPLAIIMLVCIVGGSFVLLIQQNRQELICDREVVRQQQFFALGIITRLFTVIALITNLSFYSFHQEIESTESEETRILFLAFLCLLEGLRILLYVIHSVLGYPGYRNRLSCSKAR